MSEQNPFEWAEQLGQKASSKEADLRNRKIAENAEVALKDQISASKDSEFKKRIEEFNLSLSNQVQLAVNAFNQANRTGVQVSSPVPLYNGLGFSISKIFMISPPESSQLIYPGPEVFTSIEFFCEKRSLIIWPLYSSMPLNKYTIKTKSNTAIKDCFKFELNADGHIEVKENELLIGTENLIQRFCAPIFQLVEVEG